MGRVPFRPFRPVSAFLLSAFSFLFSPFAPWSLVLWSLGPLVLLFSISAFCFLLCPLALALRRQLRYLAAHAVALALDGAGSAAIPVGWGSLTSLDPKVGSQPVRHRR